jgi:ferric-dicitrate binding protein FerR (iron transport regulator)
MKQPKHRFLWFLLLASLVLSVRVLAVRVPREEANKQVELALEYGDLIKIAEAVSMQPLDLVEQAQAWGMTSLVLLDQDLLEVPYSLLQYAHDHGLILTPQVSNTLRNKDTKT